jgi:hypothetical protein
MPSKQAVTKQYLNTHDDSLREDALHEAAETKKRWQTFLEGVSSVTKLITGPLFAVGGAATLAALATTPVVPMALGIGLLVAASLSLVTAVTSGYALESIERANQVQIADTKAKMHAQHMVQEIKSNGLCIVPEKELDALREHSASCSHDKNDSNKKDWTQRIQTAELNEAGQRSVH